jgi:protein arginine N-methyltransferase 7
MLQDSERNAMYMAAIKEVVATTPAPAHVLDIGTGTGLLAMMAAKAGAASVTACETFEPMVSISNDAIAANGLCDIITVVPKRSTELEVGEGKDMPRRADIVISEILDTELIGEGVLGTMRHMHEHLAAPGAKVVPCAATVIVQLVESAMLRGWHNPDHGEAATARGGVLLAMGECNGPASPHDLQANRLVHYTCSNRLAFDFA